MENMEAKTEDFIPPSENIYDNGFDMKPDSGKVYLKVNGKEDNYVNGKEDNYVNGKEDNYVNGKEDNYVNGKEDNYVNGKLCNTEDNAEHQVKIEVEKRTLFYRVSESPPIHLSFLFALQQSVVSIPKCLFIVALIAELTCARDVEYFKAQMFSTTVFLAGICTFCQCTFGVRLPVYQGPMSQYVLPLMALKALPDWQCPSIYTYYQGDDANGTIGNMSLMNISTGIIDSEQPSYEDVHVLPKIRLFQGSLLLAGFIHMLIGLTGVLGYLMRYVGPITVVPTLLLVSIKYASVLVKFCESSWIVSFATLCPCIILAMYLDGKKMPIPVWRPGKGFEIIHYPLHQVLSILIGIAIGWSIAGILTVTNFLSADKDSVEFYSRTDTRQHVIASAPWFYVPYPGQFGPCSFSGGIFITFLVPTIVSVIDSIADYYACARTVKVPPPPAHAINRGIALEGLFSSVAGLFGAGHATTTYGGNIGIIGMTKVASRRVFQVFGAQMVFVAIIGKFTAFFVTVPYAVLGATNIIGGGAFIGLVFSNLCYVDIKSTRNMTIIGIAIMLGLMIPIWSEENIHVFDTGIQELTNTVRILMTSPNFAGMVIACFLDNTVPGTMKERGMIAWLAGGDEEDISEQDYEEGVELYEIPALTKILRQFRISKYIPIFPTFRKMD